MVATSVSSAGCDLSDQVPEGERSREAHDRALADEARRGLECLVHRLAALLEHLLRIFRIEIAQDPRSGAVAVRALLFRCHSGGPSDAANLGTSLAHG